MKFETVKTYILFILIGISLILTFSLWNYQPKDDYLNNEQLLNEEDFDLGGQEFSKSELIIPNLIIFEKYNRHYGFTNPNDSSSLYKDMQSWVLYDFRETDANGRPNDNHQVEVIFPIQLPMSIVPSLFTLNDNSNTMPSWSFQRVYLTFESNSQLTMQFLSVDGRQQAKFDINNPSKYDMLWNQVVQLEGLMEYMVFNDNDEQPIYIPEDALTMAKQSIRVTPVDPVLFRNALFVDPYEVARNVSRDNELYYQDGQRTMQVSRDRRSMEYTNPQHTNYDPITSVELLDRSVFNINEYKGWINNYQLESIDLTDNKVRFQMYFNNYPVFDYRNLNVIEQQWRNNELYQYTSPLFSVVDSYPDEEVELPSGREISNTIKNSSDFDTSNIRDIRIGYRINDPDPSRNYLILEPVWYVNENGSWKEVSIDEVPHSKGVS